MIVVIGGGVTGLAVGMASGGLVLEAADDPGGLCCSYYLSPDGSERRAQAPADGEAYRFERGGGHWIFGGDRSVVDRLDALAPLAHYERRASVHFDGRGARVPYPVQLHIDELGPQVARAHRAELASPPEHPAVDTMQAWLLATFGPTLCAEFFFPFHDRYTAGLYTMIAPQDAHKTPDRGTGYNPTFAYPRGGLDHLTRRMAASANVRYGARVVAVDVGEREVLLADGARVPYDTLVSTIPLHETMVVTGLSVEREPDPFTSVMVWNVGAERGPDCPDDHWVYLPTSAAGAHRVGFYSNVDESFLPASARSRRDRVAAYVEHAYRGGEQPDAASLARDEAASIGELRARGWIGEVEVVDATWIDVAYTWSWPGSDWVPSARAALDAHGVHTVGRYATWTFQGIADSIRDGWCVGAALAAL